MNRWEEAEHHFKACLEGETRILGPTHHSRLNTVNFLATTYRDRGRFDEAESLYRETVELLRRAQGDEHGQTLGAKANLAITLEKKAASKNKSLRQKSDAKK